MYLIIIVVIVVVIGYMFVNKEHYTLAKYEDSEGVEQMVVIVDDGTNASSDWTAVSQEKVGKLLNKIGCKSNSSAVTGMYNIYVCKNGNVTTSPGGEFGYTIEFSNDILVSDFLSKFSK